MYKILIADKIPESAVNLLRSDQKYEVHECFHMDKAELIKEIVSYHAIIVRSATKITEEVIDAAVNLKAVGRAGSGLDNIAVAYAESRGISVFNTPGSNARAVAELTIALIFALARHLYPAVCSMKAQLWEKMSFSGQEIGGKTIGLIGFGQIGQKVGQIAAGLQMQILVYKTRPVVKSPAYPYERVSLDVLLKKSDYVSLHVPKNEQTKNLITMTALQKMKNTAYLINTSRGAIVNEQDLLAALNKGMIAGAGLDVFEQEPPKDHALTAHEKVIATPHIGGSTAESQERVGNDIVKAVMKHLETNYLFI